MSHPLRDVVRQVDLGEPLRVPKLRFDLALLVVEHQINQLVHNSIAVGGLDEERTLDRRASAQRCKGLRPKARMVISQAVVDRVWTFLTDQRHDNVLKGSKHRLELDPFRELGLFPKMSEVKGLTKELLAEQVKLEP